MRVIFVLSVLFIFHGQFATIFAQDQYISEEGYNQSLKAWEAAKAKHGDSYKLTLTFGSWTGFSSVTVLTIKEGKVVRRRYYERFYGKRQVKWYIPKRYVERGKRVGKHKKGEAPVTLDDLYALAGQYLPAKSAKEVNELDYKAYFEAEHDGLLSLIGHVPDGCMDDCFEGYRVAKIKWLK